MEILAVQPNQRVSLDHHHSSSKVIELTLGGNSLENYLQPTIIDSKKTDSQQVALDNILSI